MGWKNLKLTLDLLSHVAAFPVETQIPSKPLIRNQLYLDVGALDTPRRCSSARVELELGRGSAKSIGTLPYTYTDHGPFYPG